MAIYKKRNGNVWYAEVYVRERRRCVCRSTGKTDRAEALEVERLLQAAYSRTLPADRMHALVNALYGTEGGVNPGIPLSLAYDRYKAQLEATGRTLDRKTLAGRKRNLVLFVKWRDENYPACRNLRDVTRSVAGAYAAKFNAEPHLSDKSKREGIGDLGAVWNVLMAVDEGVKENPWRFFRKSVSESRAVTAFTPDEERRILAVAQGTEWHTACLVSRWTGLRFGDVCRLSWEDVDWEKRIVRARPSKTAHHGISVVIPLAPDLCAELERLRGAPPATGAVMPELASHYPHSEKSKYGPFSAVLARAGIEAGKHTFHSWRHTFVTRGGEAGVSRELLMRMAGHATELMSRHYDHSERLDELRGAMAAMAKAAIG